ncbi:hypothetical protein [Streptomyces sp. NPDC088923]|uniref:hypothetical protein n=1 Tax=Streptomyces sp. NPDC088923 TaxID=3365913 RepID=UPI00381B3C09
MRFLFVHGTGVRHERHEVLTGRIREGLGKVLPGAVVDSPYWGDRFGALALPDGRARSVPARRRPRTPAEDPRTPAAAPGDDAPGDPVADEWGLLLVDPLCALRLAAETGWEDTGYGPPGVRAAGLGVLELLRELPPPGDDLAALLDDTGLSVAYPLALAWIGEAPETARAARRAEGSGAAREFAGALARALVAATLAEAGEEAECSGAERDQLLLLLTALLGGEARAGAGRKVAGVFGGLAMRLGGQRALGMSRGRLTGSSSPFLGDILRYQARGHELRAHLREEIAAHPGPTVLIGHSLGGIALFDLLAEAAAEGAPLPGVRLLVTVGSQAPYLHEIGALASLAPGQPLPAGFPEWLNFFDRQDLLAYLAEPVFPGDARVRDHELSSGQPFLPCHSAYWKLPALYERLAAAVTDGE